MDRTCSVCGDIGNEEYMRFVNDVWVCSSQCATAIYTTKNISLDGGIPSDPPEGCYKVTNLYVDPTTGKFVVKFDDGGT